jgi:hypothetical protein
MNERFYIEPKIDREAAIKRMQEYTSSKLIKLWKRKQKLVSIELVYLPYWCYDYTLQSSSLKDGIHGKIAVESVSKTPAILPNDYPLLPLNKDVKGLPIIGEADPEIARKTIYWEAFRKEKRKKSIELELQSPPWLLFMPYWIGYVEGKAYEILPVDAVTGNLDLAIKDSFLKIFSVAG